MDAIVALVGHAYRGTGGEPGWTTEAHLFQGPRTDPGDVRALLAAPELTLLVAVDGGAIVGCCTVADQGRSAYFGMFAVSPLVQGAGLGKALLAEAERVAAQDLGVDRMTLTVISTRDELLAWYERRGYRRTGVVIPFPEEHRIYLRPGVTVELETLEKRLGAGGPGGGGFGAGGPGRGDTVLDADAEDPFRALG